MLDDKFCPFGNPVRIGLISDTHIPEACNDLPASVFEALSGVDLVMHAGDVYVTRVLDELSRIAPVIAAIGNGDDGSGGRRFKLDPDERVKRAHLLEVEGVRVGLVHALPMPHETSDEAFEKAMKTHFGALVEVAVVGHSHIEGVERVGSTLVVNPGSATLPHNLDDRPGTVGILEVSRGGEISVEIITLD